VVGAIGPQLGLSLVQSIVIMVVGQATGALIFGVFHADGQADRRLTARPRPDGVRSKGNNVPSIIQGVITLAWMGLNTYVALSLATYCLHKLGLPNSHAIEYGVAAVIMIIQLIIGTLGFYAIRTFEKWTVPVLATVMLVITVLAFSRGHIVSNHSTVRGDELITAASELMTTAGIGWGLSRVACASDYSRFTRPELTEKRLYWASATGMLLALIWLGVLGAAMASSSTNSDPAELVASLFGVMTIPILLVIIHGAVAGEHPTRLLGAAVLPRRRAQDQALAGEHCQRPDRQRRPRRFPGVHRIRHNVHQQHELIRDLDGRAGTIVLIDFFVLNRGRADVPPLYASAETSRHGAFAGARSSHC
jgi:NCS1 family nucleobase:cation symporter-1